MNSLEKLSFLEELNQKTIQWNTFTLCPNMSGKRTYCEFSKFTHYVISPHDFVQIIEIVADEVLLVLPKLGFMAYIEGYDIRNLQYNLLLRFGAKNIPKESGFTLQTLFTTLVRSPQNVEICKQLHKNFSTCTIKEKFEDYRY